MAANVISLMAKAPAFVIPFLVAMVLSNDCFGQLSVDGDFRFRSEYRHGFQTLANKNQDPAFFTSQRSRIILGLKDDRYSARFSVQDVRTWGSQPQTVVSDGLLSIHEAWIEYNFSQKVSLKAGRMELAYDNHRILGNLDWAQQGRKHDVAVLKFNDSTFTLHAGFAYNQDKEQSATNLYTVNNSYKTMQFLWANQQWKKLALSFLFLNNGTQYLEIDEAGVVTDHSTKFLQTTGYHGEFKDKKFFFTSFAYAQTGKDVRNRVVKAFDLNAEVGYKVAPNSQISGGFEYLSGTTNLTATGTNRSFSPLYGTNHAFNGYMDYFYVGNHANNVGLNDVFMRLKQTFGKGSLGLDIHQFRSAAEVLDPETGSARNNNLGTEVDLTYRHAVSKEFTVQAGYSHMFATTTMKVLKGGDEDATSNWAYLWIIFKPDFLKLTKSAK